MQLLDFGFFNLAPVRFAKLFQQERLKPVCCIHKNCRQLRFDSIAIWRDERARADPVTYHQKLALVRIIPKQILFPFSSSIFVGDIKGSEFD